ncbi:PIG-L deacetylase family protein [Dermatobacter hominis]|uniref:PIG-L deacetylase family protein n=1 Tax=Dermatobacter hominis TaxID=2884263 RepID=UPI001D105F15|nr:PIG-L deacetylase family protein [Dermatobacter hominis]UDY34261.1 PIG-L family deacetylase [Dermatobacter hominis]
MSTILFLHAHPDDEAIFTGGTIALLAERGHRVVVVFATSGELGLGAGEGLGDVRRAEARAACEHLGVASTVFLDHRDSGGSPAADGRSEDAFAAARADHVAAQVAALIEVEEADALVTYDAEGVYGHPDHVQAHRVGRLAAAMADLPTWYEVTVDREHLHFVDTHVAAVAGASISPSRAVGMPTVEISTTVDVSAVLVPKLRAIAEHRSQVGPDPTFGSGDHFDDVYGLEWYVRHGRRGAIDDLALDTTGGRPLEVAP